MISLMYGEGGEMTLDDYRKVLYKQEDGAWVAEVPLSAAAMP